MSRRETFAFLDEFMRISREDSDTPEHMSQLNHLLALVLVGFSKDFNIPLKSFNKAFRTKEKMKKASFEQKMRALTGCFAILQEMAMNDGVDLGFREIDLSEDDLEVFHRAEKEDVVFLAPKFAVN